MKTLSRRWPSLIVVFALLCATLLAAPVQPARAADDVPEFPYLQPDEETFREWMQAYDAAPRLEIARQAATAPGLGTSVNLLPHLSYVPTERSQGSCSNCWAWAGTGCMEIALDVQENIFDRLSVQYINSCEYDIIGKPCCRGGWLSQFADFYDATGLCIPWTNVNADWQDGDWSCDTACGSISTESSYDILSINDLTVPTHTTEGVPDDEAAAASIKSALDQGRAVWFAFFVPTPTAWSTFTSFWMSQGEDIVIDLDAVCSGTHYHAGHAVLCVGYNDEDPDDSYWVMLNSWGTAGGGRPNGLFRVNMDMDYDCTCGGYSFYWQTLNVLFSPPPPPVVTTSPADSVEATIATLNGMLVNDGGEECDSRFEYDTGSGVPYAFSTAWQSGFTAGQPFQANLDTLLPGTRYYFRAQARNSGGTSSGEEEAFPTWPLPPEQLSAAATGQDAVELAWSLGAGAGRTVVRGKKETPPSGPEDGYPVYDGTDTSCTDAGLDPGSRYFYRAWSVADDETLDLVWSDDFAEDDATTIGNGVWMEGDVNLDARANIVDALAIAQFGVGLREFDSTQLLCGDTTDDGTVNIIDAMHIAQFGVDPHGTAGVLIRPLWESPADAGLLDPLAA